MGREAASIPTVVVTGAASGIGREVAREYHRRGFRPALLDVDRAGVEEAAGELPGATAHVADVSDEAAMLAVRDEVQRSHGNVRVLVCNAGVSVAGTVERLPTEAIRRALDVNFWGVVHACRTFLPALREAASRGERASIGVVLSDFALFSLPTKAAYASSKHAARAFAEALGAELHGSGVSVTAVYPGATATGIVRRGYAIDAAKQEVEAGMLERGMTPAFVASRVVRGIEAGRSRVLIGGDTRAIDLAARLAPGLVQVAVRRFWRRIPFL
jgi:short-subunit dehydrogenase